MAAFKNFSDPVGALNEIYRVLKPARTASIYDLRKDASLHDFDEEVKGMNLSPLNAVLTKWTFRLLLLKRAYRQDALQQMLAQSRFRTCEIVQKGIGFEMRLRS
jgi:ubiquinone/menaquinone biosynthesis C-methylase UbiE